MKTPNRLTVVPVQDPARSAPPSTSTANAQQANLWVQQYGRGRRPLICGSIKGNPNPMETATIMRAQSILTMDGKVGPILPYEQALDVVRWAGEPA